MKPEEIGILIVDDEPSVRDSLQQWFRADGYRVDTANEAYSALKKLQEDPWYIILLDIKMPGMDGLDTLKAIKSSYPLIEVVMLTGHATVESAIEGMKLGALDYLMKPCEMDILLTKLKEAKDKKSKQEEKIAEARAMNIALRRGD